MDLNFVAQLLAGSIPIGLSVIGGFAWTIGRQDRLHRENREVIAEAIRAVEARLTRLENLMLAPAWRRSHTQ